MKLMVETIRNVWDSISVDEINGGNYTQCLGFNISR